MLATPISGPACVRKFNSESLVRLDSSQLVMQRLRIFLLIFLATFRASIVSAVSPLCDKVKKGYLSI